MTVSATEIGILNLVADSLERIREVFAAEYNAAEKDSVEEAIFEKLNNVFENEIDYIRDLEVASDDNSEQLDFEPED
jgi:hypothetical protein